MTPAEVADRLDARPAGPAKWQARCPAHDDHSPSLSIAGGDRGLVVRMRPAKPGGGGVWVDGEVGG